MGYILHHAIVVTGMDYNDSYDHCHAVTRAHAKAQELGMNPTPIQVTTHNGYKSFACLPDGSKEGWPPSNDGDSARDSLVEFMREMIHDDGSGPLDWVEVAYGGDEPQQNTAVLRASEFEEER